MWREWLTAGARPDRVLALSAGSLNSANAYARDQEWPVEVGPSGPVLPEAEATPSPDVRRGSMQ